MKNRSGISLTLLCVGLWASQWAMADAELQRFVEQTLTETRDRTHVPAIAALVQIDGKPAAEAAIGVRAEGSKPAVTIHDLWHLGSDTKAMTATLIARMVEQGLLSYDETMAK